MCKLMLKRHYLDDIYEPRYAFLRKQLQRNVKDLCVHTSHKRCLPKDLFQVPTKRTKLLKLSLNYPDYL